MAIKNLTDKIYNKMLRKNRGIKPPEINCVSKSSDMLWSSDLTDLLEVWGEGNAWSEIPLLLAPVSGRVLDLGCGTGVVMQKLSFLKKIELYGCDITPSYLERAAQRLISMGQISADRLKVEDARALTYSNDFFNYIYSIGALHFFSEEDINRVLAESRRVARYMVFFQLAVSKSNKDEGIITTYDSFFNNSLSWWTNKFKVFFPEYYTLDSKWEDSQSCGKWLIGVKERL